MVYLREILNQNRSKILQLKNIELAAYLYVSSRIDGSDYDFELSPDESVALSGYKNEPTQKEKVITIVTRQPIKGISASSNIYKLSGLYLAAKEDVLQYLKEKYNQSDLKQKYFLSKIEPYFIKQLIKDVSGKNDSVAVIINTILGVQSIASEVENALQEIPDWEFDIQSQVLLEDLEKLLLKTKFVNKSCEEVIRDVLNNFSNAIQKIIKDRRKDHQEFKIEDEYDVQDILYVILKSFFPLLRDEDPIPKVGAKSTKIDLILREEKVLIEVKMIKERDSNETEFIEQLKKDFESYHQCQWLEKLFCFVYDPNKKTRDLANFMDLNGERSKNGHSFSVEVIVAN